MNNLKAIRLRLGLSQKRLGELLGCTQGNVSQWERSGVVVLNKAKKLVHLANDGGLPIGFEHVLGLSAIPCDSGASNKNAKAAA